MSDDIKIPDEWYAKPLRLAEEDSEPGVSAQAYAEEMEIRRLSEIANGIPGVDTSIHENPGGWVGFPHSIVKA